MGKGPRLVHWTQLDSDALKCCKCIAAGLFLPHRSRITYKAPRLLRRVNGFFPLLLSSLNLFLHHRPARSADLKSEQLESNEFSGTATPTDTHALPSHQRLPALISSNKAKACRPFKKSVKFNVNWVWVLELRRLICVSLCMCVWTTLYMHNAFSSLFLTSSSKYVCVINVNFLKRSNLSFV